MFQDYLFYGVDLDTRYAFRMCHLSGIVEEARRLHGLNPNRAAILGEVLLGSVLLSSILEDEERINVRVQMGSEFTVASETTRHAETKGYIECSDESPLIAGIDEGSRIYGQAMVRSMRSKAGSGKVFEGVTQVTTDSMEEALNDHLAQSFQMKSGLRISSWLDPSDGKLRAFGAIFMELPDLSPKVAEELWRHVESRPPMKQLFAESDDPDVLAARLIPHGVRAIKSVNPRWLCTCSYESVHKMIRSLSPVDIAEMKEKGEVLEVKCHYCSSVYKIDPATL